MNGFTYQQTVDAALDKVSTLLAAQRFAVVELDQLVIDHPDLLGDPRLQRALEVLRS